MFITEYLGVVSFSSSYSLNLLWISLHVSILKFDLYKIGPWQESVFPDVPDGEWLATRGLCLAESQVYGVRAPSLQKRAEAAMFLLSSHTPHTVAALHWGGTRPSPDRKFSKSVLAWVDASLTDHQSGVRTFWGHPSSFLPSCLLNQELGGHTMMQHLGRLTLRSRVKPHNIATSLLPLYRVAERVPSSLGWDGGVEFNTAL